ncbi:MAG: HEAT repeat domain-containing protein [Vicinamibacteria bacterium]
MKTALAAAVSLSLACLARAEAPANVVAARVETRDGSSGLRAAIAAASAAGPLWIGYAVETSSKDGSACCWSSHRDAGACCGGCRLEGKRGDDSFDVSRSSTVLEGPRRLHVLLRVERGSVQRIRAFSQDCAIDVKPLAFVWLDGVASTDSVAYLGGLLDADRDDARERDLPDGPLMALSMHAEPRAVDVMIRTAKRHPVARVRSQSLFWLAQTAQRRAGDAIRGAIDDDPETEVKKQAVFALSQLPADEAVPHLMRLARAHANVEVKKQAMFWLGQSGDPRALAFFDDVLSK